jgi:hypothetical protein
VAAGAAEAVAPTPAGGVTLTAESLLTDLDAFYLEHRLCGELQAGVDGPVAWIVCDCGARIARRANVVDHTELDPRSRRLRVAIAALTAALVWALPAFADTEACKQRQTLAADVDALHETVRRAPDRADDLQAPLRGR